MFKFSLDFQVDAEDQSNCRKEMGFQIKLFQVKRIPFVYFTL